MGGSGSKQGLGHHSTADDVVKAFRRPDGTTPTTGKTVLITGGRHGGIGWETGRALASGGAHVILACRSQEQCDDGIQRMKASVGPDARVTGLVVDLSDLKQVRAAAQAFVATKQPLHVLVNNAGVMACPLSYTKDGLELQMGTNHVGHWLLTQELLPALKASAPARVVNLSSAAHWMFAPYPDGLFWGDLVCATPEGKAGYWPWARYGASKLANLLHAKELQARYGPQGITAVSLHPGMIGETKLARHLMSVSQVGTSLAEMAFNTRLYKNLAAEGQKNIPQGAATSVMAVMAPLAGSPDAAGAPGVLEPGAYYADCAVETARVHPAALDPAAPRRLWEETERLVAAALA